MSTIDAAAYVKLENRVRELEAALGKLRGNIASAPTSSLDLIETVTLSVAGPIRIPSVGNFPTQYKDLILRGKLRSNKAAISSDALVITQNALAANYYIIRMNNNTATTVNATEVLAAANWSPGSIPAATSPTGEFATWEMTVFDYNLSAPTHAEFRLGAFYLTTTTNNRTIQGSLRIDSAQVVNYFTFSVAAANNLLAGSYLSAYGVRG